MRGGKGGGDAGRRPAHAERQSSRAAERRPSWGFAESGSQTIREVCFSARGGWGETPIFPHELQRRGFLDDCYCFCFRLLTRFPSKQGYLLRAGRLANACAREEMMHPQTPIPAQPPWPGSARLAGGRGDALASSYSTLRLHPFLAPFSSHPNSVTHSTTRRRFFPLFFPSDVSLHASLPTLLESVHPCVPWLPSDAVQASFAPPPPNPYPPRSPPGVTPSLPW